MMERERQRNDSLVNGYYQDGDFENLRAIHEHPLTISGVSDAGAHSSIFQDGSSPTHLLTHWAGVIGRQCREPARLFGMLDRGELRAGLRADCLSQRPCRTPPPQAHRCNPLTLGCRQTGTP